MRRKRKEKKEKRPGWSLFSACLHAAAAIKSKNGTCVCVRARVYGGVLHNASRDLPEVVHPKIDRAREVWGLKLVAPNLSVMDTDERAIPICCCSKRSS